MLFIWTQRKELYKSCFTQKEKELEVLNLHSSEKNCCN